jgi:hypothetical protein
MPMNPPPQAVELKNAVRQRREAEALKPFNSAIATLSEQERELLKTYGRVVGGAIELRVPLHGVIYGELRTTLLDVTFLRWRVPAGSSLAGRIQRLGKH